MPEKKNKKSGGLFKNNRFLRTYGAFTRAGVMDCVAYKMNFICFFIGEIFYCFVMYFIWKAVFESSNGDTFMSFTMTDMVVYMFLSNITMFFTDTDSTYAIGEEIKDGSIVMRLIKPIQVDLSYLAYELGNKALVLSTVFFPVIIGVEIYKYTTLGYFAFEISKSLLFMVSIVLSYLLAFYLNLVFGYMAFFLMNLWGLNILKGSIIKFFSGAIIPLAFFPEIITKIFSTLPFASLSYTPVMIYMGKYTGKTLITALGLQLFWLFAFYLISKMVWKWAQKRILVQGG